MRQAATAEGVLALTEAISPPPQIRAEIVTELRTALSMNLPNFVELPQLPALVAGKFLRSWVSYSSYLSFGSAHTDSRLVKVAAVVELAHLATLLHDDVLDGHVVRRSAPTLHATLGAKASILVGDLVVTRALALLSGLGDPELVQIVSNALSKVFSGELEQHLCQETPSIQAYIARLEKKTGALFGASAQLAAILATNDPALARKAYALGNAIGTAYQMLDDYQDYFRNVSASERRLGEDLRCGIMTLPTLLLEERSPGAWATAAGSAMNESNISNTTEFLRDLMIRHDIGSTADHLVQEVLSEAARLSLEISSSASALTRLVEAYRRYGEDVTQTLVLS